MKKIVFMGTPEIAVPSLKALVENGFNIPLVITQPDKPKGRGQNMAFSPVKECALSYGLNVYQPEKIRNNQEAMDIIKACKPDFFAVVAYGKILPQEILDIPKTAPINVHFSLLPKYRGPAPVNWAILNGESLPVFVYKDSKVLSGSMNKDNNFLMKVTKTFDESTLTKIIELVKNEESKKSNSEKFISKFAKYYTPCVLVLAILYFFIPFAVHQFVFDNQALNYIKGSINILLTSCPCSLVISVPLTFFISIGKLSKIGVLVKGSYNIETLNKCDVFAFIDWLPCPISIDNCFFLCKTACSINQKTLLSP